MIHIVHAEIHASDLERAKRFYRDALGWEFDEYPEMNYHQMNTGPGNGPDVGLMARQDPSDLGVGAFVCTVAVEVLDDSVEAVKAAGGTLVGDPMEIPGVGRYVHARDPEGNVFGMLQPAG